MYFKERQSSALYQHYQKQEHERLFKKIQSIKNRKHKQSSTVQNILPPITHHPSQVRVYQKKMQIAETDRLSKRLEQLKNNRSQYFSKVIGLNFSFDLTKANKSTVLELHSADRHFKEDQERHQQYPLSEQR